MLITAFLKDQGRACRHPACTGGGQGSLAQRSAILTENGVINLTIIATIFKRTNTKGSGIGAPVPFMARSLPGLDAEKGGSTDLPGEVLSPPKIRYF